MKGKSHIYLEKVFFDSPEISGASKKHEKKYIRTKIIAEGTVFGNINSEGEPAFLNARYFMWKGEWDFWTSEPNLVELDVDEHLKELLVTFARNNLQSIQDQLELVDHETEILPGIRAVAASGHTPTTWRFLFPRTESNCYAFPMLRSFKPIWSSQIGMRP